MDPARDGSRSRGRCVTGIIASEGGGCGAAMRTAPIGVFYSSSRLDELIREAYECAIPTHGGQMAVCAAAAVAGAVSAALDGRPSAEVLTVAIRASKEAETLQPSGEAATITRSIAEIYSDLVRRQHLIADELAHHSTAAVARQPAHDRTVYSGGTRR